MLLPRVGLHVDRSPPAGRMSSPVSPDVERNRNLTSVEVRSPSALVQGQQKASLHLQVRDRAVACPRFPRSALVAKREWASAMAVLNTAV